MNLLYIGFNNFGKIPCTIVKEMYLKDIVVGTLPTYENYFEIEDNCEYSDSLRIIRGGVMVSEYIDYSFLEKLPSSAFKLKRVSFSKDGNPVYN